MRKKVRQWITLMLAVAMIVGAVNNDYLITLATNADGAGTEAVSGNDAVETQGVSGNEAEIQDVSGNASTEQEIVSESAAQTPALYTAGANETVYTAEQLGTPSVATGATATLQKKYKMTYKSKYQDVWFTLPDSAKYAIADVKSVTFNISSQVGSLNFFLFDSSQPNNGDNGKVANFWGKIGQTSYEITMPTENANSFDGIGVQVGNDSAGNIADGASAVLDSVVVTKTDDSSVTYTANELVEFRMWADSCETLIGSYVLTYTDIYQDIGFTLDKTFNVEEIESITFNVPSQVGGLNFYLASDGKKIGNYYGKSGKTSYEFTMADTSDTLTGSSFNGIGIQAADVEKKITEGACAVFDSVVIKLKDTTPSETEKIYTAEQLGTPSVATGATATLQKKYKMTYKSKYQDVWFTLPDSAKYAIADVKSVTFNISSQVGSLNFFLFDSSQPNNGDNGKVANFWGKIGQTSYEITMPTENANSFDGIGVQVGNDSAGNIADGASAVLDSVVVTKTDDSSVTYTANELVEFRMWADSCETLIGSYVLTYTDIYQDIGFTLDKTFNVEEIESITFNVPSQVGGLNFYLASDGKKIGNYYGKSGKTFYEFTMADTSDTLKGSSFNGIGIQASDDGKKITEGACAVLDSVVIKLKDTTPTPTPTVENKTKKVEEGYTGTALPALSSNMLYNWHNCGSYTPDEANGIYEAVYSGNWQQFQLKFVESVDLTLYDRVTFTVEGATAKIKLGLHNWSDELWSQIVDPKEDGYYTLDLNPATLTKGTTATFLNVWSTEGAQTLKFHGITFEKKSGSTPVSTENETPAGDGTDDVRIVLSDDKIEKVQVQGATTATAKENDRYEVSLDKSYKSAVFTLKEEIDLKNCTEVVFAVSEQQDNVNLLLYDNTWWSNTCEILGAYGKNTGSEECNTAAYPKSANGTVYYVFKLNDEQRARKVKHIGLSSADGASCVLHGVLFVMGDESPVIPDPTPAGENKTKAVDAGNTGLVLPALKSNMNSYYRSSNVTYEGNATTGIQTITYPDGWNQIQFTLSNAVDLTKYNKITFTVEDASKPMKFGLHYWSEETNTIDLWTATAEADASGYYTFDLNPETLTNGTTATTISIWSNGSAQTIKFHGVTFENDPNKKFESTYEVTYTAEQLKTSSSSAVYQNGAWVVAFANKDQDVTFDIPDVLNMAKCLGMTLHFSTVNGPVNFYVAKDGNKAESYWNIHNGTGAVQGSSITCGTLINQIGVQAGRENDEFVPGTTITLNGITFLMSGTRLDRPVNNGNDTSCSAGCFDFDSATKDEGVEVNPILSEDGSKVVKEEIIFKRGGTSLTFEIPDGIDVKYLRRISLQYEDKKYVSRRSVVREYGVTISLLDSSLREIAQADSNNIISLSRYFTGAKYIRLTSVGPTVMTLTGIVFTTELPIVLNGNFEDGDVTMWGSALWGDDTGKKATITAEQASESIVGSVSSYGRIYDRVSPYNCFAQDITARVTKGKIYKYSFWAKLSDAYANVPAEQRVVSFGPYYVDENGKEQYGMVPGGVYKQSLKAGEWTYFEGTVVIPWESEKFVIRILEQGTNYGQGTCVKGEYYVTGVQMWETDRMDPSMENNGGGGGNSNKRTITKTATCEVSYNPADLTVNWASATTETVANGVKISFKNNYDEARLKLTQKLDMSKCAYVKVFVTDQTVPIAVKLYKSGVQVDVDYYNSIEGSYILVPTYGGYIDAIGIMSLATPNPNGASVTITGITFGMTEEPAPYVPSGDIVINGDFADEDLSDWQAAFWDQNKGVSITRETSSTPIYGNVYTYATYSRRTSPYQCFAQDITERVEQNETYTFSFWAKLSNDYKGAPSSQRVVQFAPYTVDKDGVANYNPRLDGTYSLILEPGVWTYFEGTYKVTNDNPISQVVIRILEQGTDYGKGDCVKGSYSIAGVKMEKFIPEPPSIDEDVPNLSEALGEVFGDDFITGTALGIGEVDDLGIEMLINKHFNAVTIGNELKPDALFDYSNSQHTALQTITFNGQSLVVPTLNYSKAEEILDKVLEWNEANPDKQIKVRGHVLVWHAQTPEWFFREDYKVGKNADGTENYVSAEVMNQRLEWYIKTVLEHFLGEDSPYKDLFYGWDVVNEAVADGSKGYRTNQISASEQPSDDTHGSNSSWWAVYQSNEYIIKAFRYANKYAPANVELYYNDYNETDSGKVKGIVTLLKDVLAADGTRIDAMGMQGHYNLSYPALSDIEKAIRAYAEVVGKIQYTELDLKAGRDISSERELQNEYKAQAKRYHDIYQLLKKLDAEDGIDVGGITFWGVVDKYSWLQTASNVGGGSDGSLTQCPLLFDSDYKVKPAYWAFVDYSKVDPEYQEETKESVAEEPSEEKPEATPEPEAETSEEVPVDGDTAEIVEKGGLNMAAIIGICIAAVAVVAGGAVFAVRKKKKAPTGDSEIK